MTVDIKIDDSVDEIIKWIIKNNQNVEELLFFTTGGSYQPRARRVYLDPRALEAGRRLMSATGLPLWDAIMLSMFDVEFADRQLLADALMHNSQSINAVRYPAQGFVSGNWLKSAEGIRNVGPWILSSACKMKNGKKKHFLMLDFHCKNSRKNLKTVEEIIKLIGEPGFILNSGKSFHFYGEKMVSYGVIPIPVVGDSLGGFPDAAQM